MRARVCGACARGRVRRGMTVLTRLACKNRDDLVVRLLTSYCEPDERGNALKPDLYGNTCLHYFAACANDAAYSEVLAWGAEEMQRNNANQTAHEARESGRLTFAKGDDRRAAGNKE